MLGYKRNIQILLLFLSFNLSVYTAGQQTDYYLGTARYSFIRYNQNNLILPENDTLFKMFFMKMDSIIAFGTGKVEIVHFGGSHIQADMYTHVIRQDLQDLSPDMNGGRGLIFPMKIARQYNPSNFEVRFTGSWESCRCTEAGKSCRLGITGISVTTTDSLSTIVINPNKGSLIHYTFNRIRVFHEASLCQLFISGKDSAISGYYDTVQGCSEFFSRDDLDILELTIKNAHAEAFTLQGISLDNDFPGVVYNAMGVTGAKLDSYLRCELYQKQLHALAPDLVIFSIGTNDAYTRKFDVERYRSEYTELLNRTLQAAPDAAILLTVPNDSYLYKKYVNQNTAKMKEVIFGLAEKYHCGIWDFYTIMGGLNSSEAWRGANLMQNDKVHFNKQGYELKGELLFTAFLKSWEQQLNSVEPSYKIFGENK